MSAPKKKIYFLLSSEAYLEPISGDRINEMNIIRAMLNEYDVYYNGVLVKPEDKAFGDVNRVIHTPSEGEYDLVYIRNNKKVFLDSPSPKLWFASPYDEECFAQADGIVCMTKPWKTALQDYDSSRYEYFQATYPEDMKAPKICILFPQVIDDSHFEKQTSTVESPVSPISFKQKIKKAIGQIKTRKKSYPPFRPNKTFKLSLSNRIRSIRSHSSQYYSSRMHWGR